jgi:hypothetical protein
MGVYVPIEKVIVAYRLETWVRMYDMWAHCEEHGMICMLLAGRMVHV